MRMSKIRKTLPLACAALLTLWAVNGPLVQAAHIRPVVIDTIATCGEGSRFSGGVGVNPNTNRVYAADLVNNCVTVVDGLTDSVVATIPMQPGPYGVAVNPATNRVYVTHTQFFGNGRIV